MNHIKKEQHINIVRLVLLEKELDKKKKKITNVFLLVNFACLR